MATKIRKVSSGGIPAVATVQAARTTGVFSLTVDTQQYWPTGSTIDFSTYKVDTNNKRIAGTQTDWTGTSNGTTTLSALVAVGGAGDQGNAIGDKVQMGPTADWGEGVVDWALTQHNDDGTHKDITASSATVSGAVSAGSVAASGAVTAATATVSGKITGGLIQNGSATVATIDGSGNITPTTPYFSVSALGAAAAIQVPSFTPWAGAPCILQLYSATAEALTFASAFENVSGLDYPTTTVAGKWTTIGMVYNAIDSKWQIAGIAQGA